MRRPAAVLILTSLLFLPNCTSKSGNSGGDAVAAAKAATGSGQTGEAGAGLGAPIVIYVTDGNGDGKGGVVVDATVTTGSVTPASTTTDGTGHASFSWTLGDVDGTQTLTIHVTGLSDPVTITAVATAPALTLAAENGDNQTGTANQGLAAPVVLRVTRVRDGAGVANVPLTLAVATGGGSLDQTSLSTGTDGRATLHWTLGPVVGGQTFTVSGPNLTTLTVHATAQAEPVTLAVDSGNAQTGEVGSTLAKQVVARVTEPTGGAPVAGLTVSFAVVTGGGGVSAATAVTDAEGRARVSWTLGPSTGSQTLSISAPGATAQTVTATATPEARVLLLVSGGDQVGTNGTALPQPVVVKVARARDSAGVAGVAVNFTVTAGGGSVDHGSVITGSDGTASVMWTLGTTGAQTLHVSSTGLTSLDVGAVAGSALTNIVQISAGDYHVCAVSGTGAAYCWGENGNGELGVPGYDASYSGYPLRVTGAQTWAQVAAGYEGTCARTVAGAAYCWGKGDYGQIGNGAEDDQTSATPVSSSGQVWGQLIGGSYYNCGVTTSNIAWCWGDDFYGELGDGANTEHDSPLMVSGGHTFAQLTSSGVDGDGYTTCGLTPTGTGYCWGVNDYGEVGDGTSTDRNVPTLISGGHTFRALAGGPYDTCGILTTGGALCWGYGSDGEIGNGGGADALVPTMVSGGLSFSEIAISYETVCGLTTAGAAYCWGDDSYGELGNGTYDAANAPVPVSGGHTFIHITAGDEFFCGVTTSHLVYCWGDNSEGQLGNDVDNYDNVPVLVQAPVSPGLRRGASLLRSRTATRGTPHRASRKRPGRP